jgi:hypothetical protein
MSIQSSFSRENFFVRSPLNFGSDPLGMWNSPLSALCPWQVRHPKLANFDASWLTNTGCITGTTRVFMKAMRSS